MKKVLYISLGGMMFALGTIGIFLPFLPTTVFYLLAGFFWVRSSEKLHKKLIESASYHKYVDQPIVKKKITNKGMVKMFAGMLIVFLIPGLLVDNLVMRVTLAVVYLAHVIGLSWYLKGKNSTKMTVDKLGEPND